MQRVNSWKKILIYFSIIFFYGINNLYIYSNNTILTDKINNISETHDKNEIPESNNNKVELAEYLNTSGLKYWQNGELDKAIEYFKKSININRSIGNENAIKSLLNYIGLIYTDKEEYDSSIYYIEKSINYSREAGLKNEVCEGLINISIALQGQEKYSESNNKTHQAFTIAKELNNIKQIKSCYSILAENHEKLGDKDKSYEYFGLAASLSKHLQDKKIEDFKVRTKQAEAENKAKEEQLQTTYETLEEEKEKNKQIALQVELLNKEKELKELALKEEESRNRELAAREKARKMYNYLLGGGLSVVLVFFLLLFWQLKAKKTAYELLALKSDEVKRQKEEIETQHNIVNRQKQKITSSIQYAKHIQAAILPPEKFVKKILPEHFVLYKPKDIVSGDFYWATEKEGIIIIAVADCTGHGVPGAFMSMLGIAFLNEIVNKIGINKHIRSFKASEILDQLRDQVIQSLHQTYKVDQLKDGMDIALCIIDIEHNHLQYAGAHNPVYIVRDNEILQLEPDKMPIGIYKNANLMFTNHEIDIKEDDRIYLFSDGYYDQFGGNNNRKFMVKNFRELILRIHNLTMSEQKEILDTTIEDYKGSRDQMDDILILGMKVTKQVKKHAKYRLRNWESKRILIAEDTDINYFLLVEALKSTKAEIFRAKDGKEAVEFCMNNELDLVLMDINMPIMDGLEATKNIRKFRKNIPIIAQTAQSQPDDLNKCVEAGCNDYISKPIDLTTFLTKIDKLI